MTIEPKRTPTDVTGDYVPPISFQELHDAGRLVLPGADAYDEGYGPIGDPGDVTSEQVDPLEAFVDAWAQAGQTPTEPLLPR